MNPAVDDGLGTTIVFIDSGYSVDLEISQYVGAAFRALGYNFEELSLNDPQAAAKLNDMLATRRHELLCFISLNYYATAIRFGNQLLHHATGIPLVFYLMDHPLYFLDKQLPENAGAMVFVAGRDLMDFVGKYFPPDTIAVENQAFIEPPFEQRPPSFEDFVGRRNEILCPMNLSIWGNSLDTVWGIVKQLPAPRATFVTRLIEAALTDVFTPLHVIAESLPPGVEPEERLTSDTRLALDFVKIWRRNHMIRALIDLPILISSAYVPADLQARYPKKFTLLTIQETTPLYQQYRFVLNAFPLMTHALHDRIINAMCANAVAITDQNNFVRERFTDGLDVLFYDYDAPGMAAKISRYLDDPVAAYQITVNAYDLRTKAAVFTIDTFGELIEAVKRRKRAVA